METENVNGYPECTQCGTCCHIRFIAMTIEEAEHIFEYAEANGIEPRDLGEDVCPWLGDDNLCRIWDARCQACRLHGCKRTRYEVLEQHPELVVPEDKWLVDLRKVFVYRDFVDPRKEEGISILDMQ